MKRKETDTPMATTGVVKNAVHGAQFSGRMTVDQLAQTGTPEDAAARQRLARAGYTIPTDSALQVIHCDKRRGILANGFMQVFEAVDGQQCRILDYAPRQSLQPHYHNADELFAIGGGSIKVFKWKDIAALTAGEPPVAIEWLSKGDTLSIPARIPHCIHGHPETGVAFHELIGNFGARTTDFVKAEDDSRVVVRPMWALCDDGELRCISTQMRERYCARTALVIASDSDGSSTEHEDHQPTIAASLDLVRHLVGAGAVVVVTCSASMLNSEVGAEIRAAVCFGAFGSCAVPCDVTDPTSVRQLANHVMLETLQQHKRTTLAQEPWVAAGLEAAGLVSWHERTRDSLQHPKVPIDFLVTDSRAVKGQLPDCIEAAFEVGERVVCCGKPPC